MPIGRAASVTQFGHEEKLGHKLYYFIFISLTKGGCYCSCFTDKETEIDYRTFYHFLATSAKIQI